MGSNSASYIVCDFVILKLSKNAISTLFNSMVRILVVLLVEDALDISSKRPEGCVGLLSDLNSFANRWCIDHVLRHWADITATFNKGIGCHWRIMYNLHSELADEVGNEADSLELDPISTKCHHQLELYACRLRMVFVSPSLC
jgi:hypothetical protein